MEEPHLSAVDRGIDLEVQRQHLVRIRGPQPLIATLADSAFLANFDRTSQAFLGPQSLCALMVHGQAFCST
ncbi:hypothetical protein CJ177_36015 [Rhodococcus sp. ACPA1]|jgi:hypothetical protein|nr:hypothetical protein CJ177_36015 [Rhodococcus sp. ACPA1]